MLAKMVDLPIEFTKSLHNCTASLLNFSFQLAQGFSKFHHTYMILYIRRIYRMPNLMPTNLPNLKMQHQYGTQSPILIEPMNTCDTHLHGHLIPTGSTFMVILCLPRWLICLLNLLNPFTIVPLACLILAFNWLKDLVNSTTRI